MGSHRAFVVKGRAVVTHDNAKTKPWQLTVQWSAKAEMFGKEPIEGPVNVSVVFFMPRPAGHSGVRGLRPSAPARPAVKPDLDKLVRSTLDGLTGVVFRDDAQVVTISAEKRFADGRAPGADIVVRAA